MDPRPLRHFATLAETLHFGRAAERLGMTQPPLSQSIQALERSLGAALFARTKRSVALTPFGAAWLGPVREALAALDALAEKARRLRDGEAGRLELSFVSTADYSILPALVQRYATLHPEVDLILTEATTDVQIEALVRGQGSAGIVIPGTTEALPPRLRYRPLIREALIAAIPEAWIEARRIRLARGRLAPASLLAAPLVLFPRRSSPAFHDLVTGYVEGLGGTIRIAQEAIQMQTIIALVSAGMGIALVPASLRHLARTGVRYVDLARDAPVLETGLAWRADDAAPTLARFLAVVAAEAAGAAPSRA